MKYIKDLRYGEKAVGNKLMIKWRLDRDRAPSDTYVLTLPEYGGGLLDIYRSSQLKHKFYKRHPLTVVGVACGYQDAIELAASIVMETFEHAGDFDVSHYLLEEK